MGNNGSKSPAGSSASHQSRSKIVKMVFITLLAICAFVSVLQLNILVVPPLNAVRCVDGLNPSTVLAAAADDSGGSGGDGGIKHQIDVVVVCHSDDSEVLLPYAIKSLVKNIIDMRYVFIVGNDLLLEKMEKLKAEGYESVPWDKVYTISETEYPFTKDDVKQARVILTPNNPWAEDNPYKSWVGWTYQQLLKMYSHRVLGKNHPGRPKLLPTALIADGDAIWIRPVEMLVKPSLLTSSTEKADKEKKAGGVSNGKAVTTATSLSASSMPKVWYTIASGQSGAFREDCWHGHTAVNQNMETCPNYSAVLDNAFTSDVFTAIAHHQIFQADVMESLLSSLEYQEDENENGVEEEKGGEGQKKKPSASDWPCIPKRIQHSGYDKEKYAWAQLAANIPFLSEYETYFAWVTYAYPERVAVRTLPYANKGLSWAKEQAAEGIPIENQFAGSVPPVAFVAMHSDYSHNMCCVNTDWDPCGCCSENNGDMCRKERRLRVSLFRACEHLSSDVIPYLKCVRGLLAVEEF